MNRRRRNNRSSGSGRSAPEAVDLRAWWGYPKSEGNGSNGDSESKPDAVKMIRPTPEPGGLPRSLGSPPFPVRPGLAEAHLDAVYEEAVRAATALAAANGLLPTSTSEDIEG